jgi:hypothetical protein
MQLFDYILVFVPEENLDIVPIRARPDQGRVGVALVVDQSGSEYGYIIKLNVPAYKFGGGYDEADGS